MLFFNFHIKIPDNIYDDVTKKKYPLIICKIAPMLDHRTIIRKNPPKKVASNTKRSFSAKNLINSANPK